MTSDRQACGLTSFLPMSCRGRAEAFARRLQSRLQSLGRQPSDLGAGDDVTAATLGEETWLAGHSFPPTSRQPSSESSDLYFDFDCESPQEEATETIHLNRRRFEEEESGRGSAATSSTATTAATPPGSSDGSSDNCCFYDTPETPLRDDDLSALIDSTLRESCGHVMCCDPESAYSSDFTALLNGHPDAGKPLLSSSSSDETTPTNETGDETPDDGLRRCRRRARKPRVDYTHINGGISSHDRRRNGTSGAHETRRGTEDEKPHEHEQTEQVVKTSAGPQTSETNPGSAHKKALTNAHEVWAETNEAHDVHTEKYEAEAKSHERETNTHEVEAEKCIAKSKAHEVHTEKYKAEAKANDWESSSHEDEAEKCEAKSKAHEGEWNRHEVETETNEADSETHEAKSNRHEVDSERECESEPTRAHEGETNRPEVVEQTESGCDPEEAETHEELDNSTETPEVGADCVDDVRRANREVENAAESPLSPTAGLTYKTCVLLHGGVEESCDDMFLSSLNILKQELMIECPVAVTTTRVPDVEITEATPGEETTPLEVKVEGVDSKRLDVDDDIDDDRPQRVRRCSSLKTGKTPPGTPGRKKIVRFADVLGLDLADVRTFLDEVPKVPNSAYEDLQDADLSLGSASSVGAVVASLNHPPPPPPSRLLVPLFAQPGGAPDFLDRVREQQVCLENALVRDPALGTIAGTVRVRNLDFHKSVHVRYTLDGWRTFSDLRASYVPNSCDGFSDTFAFTLYAHHVAVGQRLEFAVRFQCHGCQYWDSNRGTNYAFQCLPPAGQTPFRPSVPPMSTCPDEQWASFY